MKIRNPFNYNAVIERYEQFTLPSLTVPDCTLTIREIFDRYARGSVLPMKEVLWDEDPEQELPDLDHMDLADRAALRETASFELEVLKKKKHVKKTENVSGEQSSDKETENVSGEQSSQNDGS